MTSIKNDCISSHVGFICLNQSTIQAPLLNLPKSPLTCPKTKQKHDLQKKKNVCTLSLGVIFVKSKHIHRFCERFHKFCQNFHRFCPDFHLIKNFGDAVAPHLLRQWPSRNPTACFAEPYGSAETLLKSTDLHFQVSWLTPLF